MSDNENGGSARAPDDAPPPAAPPVEKSKAPEQVNILTVMEDISDKLKILNYETEFCKQKSLKPLSRQYFAIPGKASEQFPYFSALGAWLLTLNGASFLEWNEFDDPNQISNNIFQELKKMGFTASFPVSKLRHGAGDAVCLSLNFLLDQTLAHRNFSPKAPVHNTSDVAEEAAVDDEAELNDENPGDDGIEDAVGDGGELTTDAYFQDNSMPTVKDAQDEDEREMHEMLESKVDPAVWKLEVERVGPRLKFKGGVPAKEWRTHIEQTEKHSKGISAAFPDSKTSLEKIGKELRAAIDRVSGKEKHINKEFDHLGAEFREKQKNLDEIQEKYNELSQSAGVLMSEMQEKTEAVQEIKAHMGEKNSAMTDTTPIRKIQDALKGLKNDVLAMELRIGVLGQTLLQQKLKSGQYGRQPGKKYD